MKIHYLSCHSTLEYDELKLLTEMGHEVFSNGAYLNPKIETNLLPRPALPQAPYFMDYEKLALENPKTNLPAELIEPFDVIIVMHTPEVIVQNWDRMKHKKVVWRSIGQSTRAVENMIRRMRYEGMKIIRYSPKEVHIPDYLGADIIIRFYKDPEEFKGWTGHVCRVVNFTQSLKARREFCHYDDIMAMVDGFPATVFGSGNDDLGPLNGGCLTYDGMKGQLRDNRVFVYGGTWPAPYTLSLQEAMMTGIPVVAIGRKMAEELPTHVVPETSRMNFYEVPDFIENGRNGFIADDINTLRNHIHALLQDVELAKMIGGGGRAKAIELFNKDYIYGQWKAFLESL